MPWRPLPRIAFAICTFPFQPSSPADLPLEIGDELYIIEQGGKDGSWYRGYLVAPPSLLAGLTSSKGQTLEARVFSGIFPRCCVEVREVLGEGKPSAEADDRPKDYFQGLLNGEGQGSDSDQPVNGVITPDESTSTSPATGRSQPAVANNLGLALTPSDKKRESVLLRHGSSKANGEYSPGFFLPLSPVSVTSRDPNAPRPPAPVPMLKIGDETPTSLSEPLVDEIASCLREWHSTKLHELLLARRYGTLDKMTTLVQKLDSSRRQLLHKVLTKKELEAVREATVWDLVSGNKTLSGEVIVRSPSQKGRILTSEDSAIEVTRLQSMMSLLDERPVQTMDEHVLHHLAVTLRHFSGEIKHPTTLCMSLCAKLPGSAAFPLSEVFSVDLNSPEAVVAAVAEEKMKSLFVDLSSHDLGEGAGAGTSLYLVIKVLTNEAVRTSTPTQSAATISRETTQSPSSGGLQHSASVKGGRRSLMWGTKRKESDPGEKPPGLKAATTSVSRPSSEGQGSNGRATTPKDGKTVKRAIAIGVLHLENLAKDPQEIEQEVTLWTPSQPLDEIAEECDAWPELIPELNPSVTGRYKQYPFMNRLQIHVKSFAHADAETLIQKTPTLLHNVNQSKKIGFSGAPTKPRSDIYLTLSEPFLPRNCFLSHPRNGSVTMSTTSNMANLQLTLEVRKSTGERIENCIYPSGNSAGHTAWRTTAVERGEAWNTTIRFAIAPEDVPGSHVVMSVADAPGFPFALCWMPLWTDDAFVRDGDHSLALYKYDEYTSSMISGRGAYLALPWNAQKKDESGTGTMATLRVKTYLCSTKYSQDPYLLELLKWREQDDSDGISDLLRRFMFVPEIEIVKLLPEVLDALFEVLVEYAGTDEVEDLVFNTLVMVLGIVYDRRFNLSPLVDQYAQNRFNYPFATASLIRSFNRLLSKPTNPDSSRKLRATFKVGAHIFKFIMKARQQQQDKEAGIGMNNRQENFVNDMQKIFKSLEDLMSNSAAALVGTKTLLVQHIHQWLPELTLCLEPKEVLELASSFIDSCFEASGKLILYKLILILQFSRIEAFKDPETRPTLLQNTVRWLAPHWGKTVAVTPQWKDQVRLCCSVVASQINELGPEAAEYIPKLVDSYMAISSTPRSQKNTLSLLFPSSYPFPSKPTTTEAAFDEGLVEILGVLAAITNLPINITPDLPKPELATFLFDTLQVYLSFLDGEAFPSSWLSVNIYHHRATMKALEKLCSILVDSFLPDPDEADDFNTDLWRSFFDALLKLVGSDALALETFPEQKRRAVWKIAGDVRELGAELLRRSWETIGWETAPEERKAYGLEKMGGYQVQYVPGLVAPIVELCLSVHQGLRSVAIQVLQTMIISEWTLSSDLALIQAEMIDCLDHLFKSKEITESILQKLFISELIDLFEPLAEDPDDPLFNAVKDLIGTIDELLDLLVAVHGRENSGEIFHIMDTLHLMEFLKDMQKEDIYIRYVHQLAEIQADAGNHTEAGLALRLHAELYEWDANMTVPGLEHPGFPSQSSFERKEQLYFEMIKHYEEGMSWNNALQAYQELATQYETNIFDFSKLARTQRAMATVYESINKGERQIPRYFRVVYKGMGFPVSLRDKQFIFEGSPTDSRATFTDRLQQQHPSAQISTGANEEDVEGQYLQIYSVSAQKDLTHPIYQRPKVGQAIREHYVLSRPSRFSTTSRRHVSDTSLKEQTIRKTIYTTAEPFPTILRRSEIITVEQVDLSPVQSALERTLRKTAELASLEKRVTSGEDSALQQLTEALMLSVDSNSPATVARYRELLPQQPEQAESVIDDDEEPEPVQLSQMENALKVALMDHALTVKRCLAAYTRPAQQATAADLSSRFETTYGYELEALFASGHSPFPNSQTSSWINSQSRAASTTPTPQQPQLLKQSTTMPVSDSRASRQEKHRLSLTFLKRSSVSQPFMEGRKLYVVNGDDADNDEDTGPPRSRSKDHGQGGLSHRLSFLHGTTTNESSGGASQRSMSIERPKTSRSESSQSQSISDRMTGNVKKRFSMLNIGKKASKNFKLGESVAEE
ncbi:Deoxycytidine kinase 1 [Diplodia seriata]|uniref:Dedicator of cytokinesis protein 1 n=1 Tax=Diplodia seriata TaxID=420778 RepID=A0A1S8BBL9_9PEZI|nr:Dedicator of cytokinesis protein 1 [Diplodia seriata]